MTTKTQAIERLILRANLAQDVADQVRTYAQFQPGLVIVTPRAKTLFAQTRECPTLLLIQHVCCLWGRVGLDEWAQNAVNLDEGTGRLTSHYELSDGSSIYLITDLDNGTTTFA